MSRRAVAMAAGQLLLVALILFVASMTHLTSTAEATPAAGVEATPDLPLSGEAWTLADRAFRAYDSEDFEAASRYAAQAIALAPEAPQLYLLQIYALQRQGQPEAAREVAEDALKQGLRRDEFSGLVTSGGATGQEGATTVEAPRTVARLSALELRRREAFRWAEAAYRAYDQSDYAAAAELAERAFRGDPRQDSWALLWVDSLAAENKAEAVNAAIDDAVLLGATDPALESRRIDLLAWRERQRREALALAAINWAERAYQYYADDAHAEAIDAARWAAALEPDNTDWQTLLTTSLAAGSPTDRLEALDRLNEHLVTNPDDLNARTERAYLYQSMGEPTLAVADFDDVLAREGVSSRVTLDAGFAAAASGDKRKGSQYLRNAIDLADQGRLALDASEREDLRRNIANLSREWGAYTSVGYRGARAATSGLGGSPIAALGDATFNTAEIFWRPSFLLNSSSRVFEMYGRLSHTLHDSGTQVPATIDACGNPLPPDSYRSVSGMPSSVGALGMRVTPDTALGMTLGVERRFDLGSRARLGSATPVDCSRGTPGQEYLTRPGDGDTLAYLTYAHYRGTELRHDQSRWWRVEGYAQAGYLWRNDSARFRDSGATAFDRDGRIEREYWFLTTEWRVGQSVRFARWSPSLLWYPHWVVAADWQKENRRARIDGLGRYALQGNGSSWSVGTGPGIGVRYWFRADRYRAEQSYVDWTIQYRFHVAGERDRSKGLFMNLTLSW